jgi:ribosomal protein L11 methyltransferase
MWLSVSVQTDAARAEALSDALMDLGALSVSVEDADAGTEREKPQFGEPGSALVPLWQSSRVIALVQADADVPALLEAAAEAIGLDTLPTWEVAQVEEQNWVQLTQSQFDPIKVTDRLWIVPSWHVEPDPAAINLVLDPGMAFGTGSHPTTFLCLSWLCDTVQPGESVLDYGCGSGILAIAAARLGAGRVVGVDIDDQALKAAADNATGNDVEIHLLHSGKPLLARFNRVVANILTNPLCVLAPLLAARVAPEGYLALSGVLESQAQQVIAAYAPFIALSVAATREGWVLLTGQTGMALSAKPEA